MNQFVANTGAITGLQGAVGSVSEDISSFRNSFSGPSDLESSHGPIGSFVQGASSGAMSSRDSALGATQVAAGRMSDLLGQASKAYERGDLAAAERLKAQADALGGSSSASGVGGGSAPAAGGGGADGAGQMMGQFSQMAGQMMQSVTQPLQGLTQAMTQVPQQVMQGVQGIVEAATQAAGGGGDAAATAADVGGAGAGAEDAIKANAAGHQGPGDGQGDGSDGGPADPHDSKHDGQDDKNDGEPERRAEAGAGALGHNEQLGDRASAGVRPADGYGVGAVPTQVHNINPRRQ